MAEFTKRYRQSGTPLANRGNEGRNPDFSEWRLRIHPEIINALETNIDPNSRQYQNANELAADELLCCPEDHHCHRTCVREKLLCPECWIPVCTDCSIAMWKNTIAPMSLVNDNFHGYLDSWLYQNDITWMENSIDTLLDWHDAILYR